MVMVTSFGYGRNCKHICSLSLTEVMETSAAGGGGRAPQRLAANRNGYSPHPEPSAPGIPGVAEVPPIREKFQASSLSTRQRIAIPLRIVLLLLSIGKTHPGPGSPPPSSELEAEPGCGGFHQLQFRPRPFGLSLRSTMRSRVNRSRHHPFRRSAPRFVPEPQGGRCLVVSAHSLQPLRLRIGATRSRGQDIEQDNDHSKRLRLERTPHDIRRRDMSGDRL